MALPFTAGQRLTAADLNAATQQSAWTSYATSWTAAGTAPAIGNGTLAARYSKVGRLVSVWLSWVKGSTTTLGTGTWSFTLPPYANANSGERAGSAVANCASTTYYGSIFVAAGTVSPFFGTTGQFASSTTPGAWGTSDTLDLTFAYESTS